MIIFFEYGRLGNQIMQYSSLIEFFPKDRIIFFGFSDLKRFIYTRKNVFFIKQYFFPDWFFNGFLKWFFKSCSKIKIISKASINSTGIIKINRGLFFNIIFIEYFIFCYSYFFKAGYLKIKIRDYFQAEARNYLSRYSQDVSYKDIVFVHIRRGDYVNYPNNVYPAVLNLNWFNEAISIFKAKNPKFKFVFLTDDKHYVKDFFNLNRNNDFFVSNSNIFVEMAIISLCSFGIISPSSFSLSGIMLSDSFSHLPPNGEERYFLAPKFWIGHIKREWYPVEMEQVKFLAFI